MEPKFFDNTNLQQPRNDPAYESKPSLDTTQSTISYRPDIDGLRGISVIAIVLFHLSKSIIPGGFVGVDMFFVISGFLVGKIILSEIANNKFTYENFYIRRVKRILPAAFVLLFLTLGAGFYVYGGVTTQFKSLTMATLYSAFSGANFYVCFVDSQSYFEPSTELKPLTHMWSLAVEEQFYLIWPFLLSYFYSFARRAADENKLLLKIVGAFTLSSFVLSEVLVRIKLDVAYYLLPSRMGELALGTLVSLLEPSCESLNSMLKNLISLVGTALFIVSFIFYNEKLSFPGFLSVVPSLGIALIILAGSEVIISRVYSLSIFRNIGLASYSIYLYHWPIMSFLRSLSYKFEGLNLVSILLFVGASSALSYFYVENGFRWVKWRNLVTFFALFVIPLVVLSTICAVFLYLPTPQYPIAVDNSTFSAEILRHFSPEEIRSANTYWTQNLKKIHSETGGLLGTLDSPHVVLIIGDSHALQFSSFIDQFQEASFPVKISVNVTNACPPLLYSADFLDRFQSQKCARFVRQTERNIESLGIKSVILVSWWRDLIGIAYEHNPVLQNPEFPAAFKRTLEGFRKNNITVLVISNGPTFLDLPRECPVILPINNSALKEQMCMRTSSYKNFSRDYRILERMASQMTGVYFWDYSPFICPDGVCSPYYKGKLMYWEITHYNEIMARTVALDILANYNLPVPIELILKAATNSNF